MVVHGGQANDNQLLVPGNNAAYRMLLSQIRL